MLTNSSNNITSCNFNQQCIDSQRVNTSAAFFLSIEFQQTGYLVERMYKAAYGDASGTSTYLGTHTLSVPVVRFSEFLPDTQQIGQGRGGQPDWLGNCAGEQQTNFREPVRATVAIHFGVSDFDGAGAVCRHS